MTLMPLKKIQSNARAYFSKNGWPAPHDEEWKYTSTKELKELNLSPNLLGKQKPQVNEKHIFPLLPKNFYNLVFVNGQFIETLSNVEKHKEFFEVSFFAEGNVKLSSILAKFRNERKNLGGVEQDSLEAMNSIFSETGVIICVKANCRLNKPIHIFHYVDQNLTASYIKNYVICESQSKTTLIESYTGAKEAICFSNAVTEIILQESSQMNYIRAQEESISSFNYGRTRFYLKKNSSLESLAYSTGAKLARHNLDVYLTGAQASARINGIYLASGHQHIDNHTLIDHACGECISSQLYKGLLSGEARAVFDGKVQIRRNSQKAFSEQLNKTLLLSSKAEIDSKPQLQIFADDVKATHGSTVGQLNPDEIFYFLSRAIPRQTAVEILSLGFVSDPIFQVSDKKIQAWLYSKLAKVFQDRKNL